jgi:hypothetical protein
LKFGIYQPAADLDMVFFRVGFGTEFGHNFAVDGHFAAFYQILSGTPRSNAGLGNKFLQPFEHKGNYESEPGAVATGFLYQQPRENAQWKIKSRADDRFSIIRFQLFDYKNPVATAPGSDKYV